MNSEIDNTESLLRDSKSKEYEQNDFTVVNAYIDSLAYNQKAKIKQISFANKANRLKIIILSLIALLIVSVCLLFWVLSAKGLALTTTAKFNATTSSATSFENIRSAAKTRLKAEAPTVVELVQPPVVSVDRNFIIFESFNDDQNKLDNINSVTTGYQYSNSEEEFPSYQFCYARGNKVMGNARIRINVAKFSGGKIFPHEMNNDGLKQANISQDTFKKLINYCRFESQ
jgi:hypothetical protein